MGATVNGLLTGHVELKLPGLGERPEHFTRHNRSQREQFRALPNLICADGGEWSLYRSGELKPGARIAADVSQGGARAVDPGPLDTIRELLRDFLYWDPIVPGTAEGLARFLAPLARVLRDDVRAALAGEASPLRALASEWTGLLFPEEDAQIADADADAQTVAHALLLARFEGAESLRPVIAVDALQREHGLFAEGLQLLEAPAVREELRMPIELLERAILAEDSAKLGQSADPWWYFYEQFLSAYDPKLRKDCGVYYTPVEVVRAQVTLAGELLRTRFGKPLVFADDDVVVLDPAVGTGTHPLAVLMAELSGVLPELFVRRYWGVPQRLRYTVQAPNGFRTLQPSAPHLAQSGGQHWEPPAQPLEQPFRICGIGDEDHGAPGGIEVVQKGRSVSCHRVGQRIRGIPSVDFGMRLQFVLHPLWEFGGQLHLDEMKAFTQF